MSQVLEVLRHFVLEVLEHFRALGINPLAAVVIAALVAAIGEQHWLRRRTPDFSTAFRDVHSRPDKPPAPVGPAPVGKSRRA